MFGPVSIVAIREFTAFPEPRSQRDTQKLAGISQWKICAVHGDVY